MADLDDSLEDIDLDAEMDSLDEEPEKGELRVISYGIVYAIAIIITLFVVISFLFFQDTNPETLEEPPGPEIVISFADYPNFFFNDTSHFPNGSVSVDGERCELCHETSGNELIYELETFKLYNNTLDTLAKKCYKCHVDPKHKVETPYNLCTECHYQGDTHNALSLSFNNVLERLGTIENRFCEECHTEQCSELQKVGHTHEDTCTNCHNDHKKVPGCLDCHDPSSVGPYHTLSKPEFEYCTDCHIGGAHTRPVINDGMDCSICHSDYYQNTLEKYGGRHFTNETLGGCDSCHTSHKEYPSCRDCHGTFPKHLETGAVQNPNQDCTVCHEGGAHDSRVNYQNYRPDLGDQICKVCHSTEYEIYYEGSTPGERELYGNCLNCHEEHNTQIKIPHLNGTEFSNCSDCHVGYSGSESMHIIEYTSYKAFPYDQVPDSFCANCHNDEYESYSNSSTGFVDYYGSCTNCHIDHKLKSNPHPAGSKYESCISCHTTYNENITIHSSKYIVYENFGSDIENTFCSSCHSAQYDELSKGSHSKRECTDCHGKHRTVMVDFSKCSVCHSTIPASHDSEKNDCLNCHNLDAIHT